MVGAFLGDRDSYSPSDKTQKKFDWTANIVSPILGSLAANLVLQPFDLVKFKMQSLSGQNISMFEAARQIYTLGGIRGFYKGAAINFLGGGLISSFRWTLYKNLYYRGKTSEVWKDVPTRIVVTSLIFAVTIPILVTPVDHARIKVNFSKQQQYSGQFDAFNKILKNHGVKGLYKANGVTIARDFIYYIVFFTVFENVQSFFDKNNHHSLGLSVASVSSAALAWTSSYPLDTVKTVLQKDDIANPKWNSFTYLWHLKEQKRLITLYNGLFSVLLRSAPVSMIFFTVWDHSLKFFKRMRKREKLAENQI